MLAEGLSPTAALARLNEAIGVRARVLPMSDDPVRTWVRTGAGWFSFQQFMIRERAAGLIEGLEFRGAEQARAERADARREIAGAACDRVIGPCKPARSRSPRSSPCPASTRRSLASTAPVVARQPDRRRRGAQGSHGLIHGVRRAGVPAPTASPTSTASLLDGMIAGRERRATAATLQTDTRMDDAAGRCTVARPTHRSSPPPSPPDTSCPTSLRESAAPRRVRSLAGRWPIVCRAACARPRSSPSSASSHAKQRLGASVADPMRLELAQSDGRRRLARAHADRVDRADDRRHPRAARSPPLARGIGALVLEDAPEAGQSAAVQIGVRRALAEGIERVLCIPGDCPALDPAELDGAAREPTSPRGSRRGWTRRSEAPLRFGAAQARS